MSDTTEMNPQVIQILAGAAVAAGARDKNWEMRVADAAVDITCMAQSVTGQMIESLLRGRSFTGVIESYELEESSKRLVVSYKGAKLSRFADKKTQLETVRTERTDNYRGRRMAAQLEGLIGHTVRFHIGMEKMAGTDTDAKALIKIVDLGIHSETKA